MKYLVPLIPIVALLVSGCALFGPSVEKAREVAQNREQLLHDAFQDFEAAGKAVDELVGKYNAAKASGDTDAIEAIEAVLPEAVARYKNAEAAYKSAEDVYKAAVADFKDAQSTSDYIGTVLGWLAAGLGGVLGIGGVRKASVAKEALTGATAAIDGLKKSNANWATEKTDHINSLSAAAKKLIDNVRP